jgi:hypothetical protein
MHPAPGDRRPRCRPLARQPRGTPTRRHAAEVAGTHRSRRPVEAPDLALLRSPGDPYGHHQPGSSPQGSPLRLRYSAWFVIRSLPVEDGIPEILAEQRLGHDVPGMRGLYTHVSPQMRDDLIAALQARWENRCGSEPASTRAPPFSCLTTCSRRSGPTRRRSPKFLPERQQLPSSA